MIKRLHLFVVLLMYFCATGAQSILVTAPSHVAVGENFRIAYTVNTQEVEEFRAGNIPSGLEVIAGPYTSQQQSFQMINGRTSSSSSITYTYTLYAEKNGSYNIPGARARIGGKTYTSKDVHIKVSGTASTRNGAPKMHDDSEESMRAAGTPISGNDLFVKVSANKKRVYEQEPILLTYKVYTLVDLTSLDGKMPDLTGFHTQEVKLPLQKSWHLEKVNGRNYKCVTWSQYVMYPQMTGKLKIPSITFKGNVVQQNRAVDPFEAFFNGGSGYVEVKRNIVAPALEVQVDPLPSKPSGFSGGVGRFNISAHVDKTEAKAGEPITVRVVVGGVGNLKLMKQPTVSFPKDFDKYDPKITDKTNVTTNGLEGNMVYDFLVVPRNQGKYTIPAVALTYFDVSAKEYKTVKTRPMSIAVEKGDGNASSVVDYSQEKENDIRGLKAGAADVHEVADFFFGSVAYVVCLLSPFLAFVVLLVVFRKRAIDNADIVKMRGRKANKVAIKRLKVAHSLMLSNRQNDFYDEVLRALWGYVSDKLNMPVEQLSRENIVDNLERNSIKNSTIDKFIGAIDECEFERYAPGDATGNMDKTYNSAIVAIMDIEDSMKISKKKRMGGGRAIILFFLLFAVQLSALSTSKAIADNEYSKGNYQQAIADYNELLKKGASADVFYNLGNAYYRTGNIPQAILAYERALMLSPGDRDIRFNLQFVRNKTIDKVIPRSEMFFVTWYRSLVNIMSVDGWAWLSIVSVAIALFLFLLFLFGSRVYLRKSGFYGALVFMVLFVLSNVFAYQQRQQFVERHSAIVVAPTVNVKKTPADSSGDAFVIHEGTKVDVIDRTMRDWRNIELADGREGWIKASHIEDI